MNRIVTPGTRVRRAAASALAAAFLALAATASATPEANPTTGVHTTPHLPLEVSKTATTSYTRLFDWSITKRATPETITTREDRATFSYVVDVTKGAPIDSGFAVSGVITVTNPNSWDITGVTVEDELSGGQDCPLGVVVPYTSLGVSGLTIPGNGYVTIPYRCPLASKTDGKNEATVTWPDGWASTEVDFTFGEPTTVINATVDVTDAFNNGQPVAIPGGTALADSAQFIYLRTVSVPDAGCKTYPNLATITSPNQLVATASASVQACREAAVIGVPDAKLSITKRGPKRASSGQVVTFTIALRNTSTTDATSVVLNDILPSGFTFYRVPKGAKLVKGKLVWNVGTLAVGASKTVKVQARIAKSASGTRCNTAVASAGNAPTVRSRACTNVLRVAGAVRVPGVTG